MKTGLNTWLGIEKFKARIIERFDAISRKYEDTYCDARSQGCLMQDLYSLYECEVGPMLGDELGKNVFRGALVQYCGSAYGVSLYEELFSPSLEN